MRGVHAVLMVLLALPAAGLADEAPCSGVTCSGHGTCIAMGGMPQCSCDEDFASTEDGVGCQPREKAPGWRTAPSPERIALGAAVTGFVSTGIVGGVGAAGIIGWAAGAPELVWMTAGSSILGSATCVLTGALTSTGLEQEPGAGSVVLRAFGWVSYAGGASLAMLQYHPLTREFMGAMLSMAMVATSLGVLTVSQLLLSVDALLVHRELASPEAPIEARRDDARLALVPMLTPVGSDDAITGAVAGVGGRF